MIGSKYVTVVPHVTVFQRKMLVDGELVGHTGTITSRDRKERKWFFSPTLEGKACGLKRTSSASSLHELTKWVQRDVTVLVLRSVAESLSPSMRELLRELDSSTVYQSGKKKGTTKRELDRWAYARGARNRTFSALVRRGLVVHSVNRRWYVSQQGHIVAGILKRMERKR